MVWSSSGEYETVIMTAMWFSIYSKSTFGFIYVKFIGYEVKDGKSCTSEESVYSSVEFIRLYNRVSQVI